MEKFVKALQKQQSKDKTKPDDKSGNAGKKDDDGDDGMALD